jgi:hypothetical protein
MATCSYGFVGADLIDCDWEITSWELPASRTDTTITSSFDNR